MNLTLLTDLYELTMACGYWKSGYAEKEAVFHLFFRRKPFQGSFAIAAGLETVLNILQEFRFESSDLSYLPPDVAVPAIEDFAEQVSQTLSRCLRPGDFPKLVIEIGFSPLMKARLLNASTDSFMKLLVRCP